MAVAAAAGLCRAELDKVVSADVSCVSGAAFVAAQDGRVLYGAAERRGAHHEEVLRAESGASVGAAAGAGVFVPCRATETGGRAVRSDGRTDAADAQRQEQQRGVRPAPDGSVPNLSLEGASGRRRRGDLTG